MPNTPARHRVTVPATNERIVPETVKSTANPYEINAATHSAFLPLVYTVANKAKEAFGPLEEAVYEYDAGLQQIGPTDGSYLVQDRIVEELEKATGKSGRFICSIDCKPGYSKLGGSFLEKTTIYVRLIAG